MVFILCYILHDALTDGPLFFPHVPSERSFVCLSPSPEFRAQPLTSTAARESREGCLVLQPSPCLGVPLYLGMWS